MTEQIIKVLKDNSSFLDRSRSEQGIHEDNFEYIAKEIKEAISFTHERMDDFNLSVEQLAAGCDEACWFHCTKGGSQDPICMNTDKS